MTKRLLSILAVSLLLLVACEKPEAGSSAKLDIPISSDPAPLNVPQPLRIGALEIQVEIALNISEQATGLMFRESMPENNGMLFVYGQPQQMSFWMKNTLIPLDIGFIDSDGKLTEVVRMYPKDLSSKRSQSDQIKFALEMNQGWFANNGIYPGAYLDLDSLRRAIAARGVDSANYGL